MSIFLDVATELFGMFVADQRLAVGVLVLVGLVAFIVDGLGIAPLAGGGLLSSAAFSSLSRLLFARLEDSRNINPVPTCPNIKRSFE